MYREKIYGALVEILVVTQPLKELPNGTRWFFVMFTKARYWCLLFSK
jgi:hypothetical protein